MRDTLGFQKLILMIVVASPEVGSFHNLVILNERERANEQRRERESAAVSCLIRHPAWGIAPAPS